MNYEYSLRKSSLVAVIAGCAVIGVLLFGAGLIVGSQWLSGSAAASDTTAKNNEPTLPKEPVLNDEKQAAPKAVPPKTTAPPAVPEPAGPAPGAEAVAPPAAATTSAEPNGEIQIIHEAAADSSNDNAASQPDYVTVQIGVFLDEKEADRLLKEVERKGYAPSFFSGRDAEARQWFAVRIGAYSDKQQAANAAANFTKQEKLRAVVRPLGSL